MPARNPGNHRPTGEGSVTKLTGTIDYIDDVGVKTAVISQP